MDRKTSFVFFLAEFLSAVHNFRKSQVADLIIALCEINYYGDLSIKLSEPVKKRLETLHGSLRTIIQHNRYPAGKVNIGLHLIF